MMKSRKNKPVYCSHCDREFASGAGLALHMRWVNGMTHPMKGKKLEGEQLKIRLNSIKEVKPHLLSPTNKPRVEFTCQWCGKKKEITECYLGRRKYCSTKCQQLASKGREMSDSQKEKLSIARKKWFAEDPRRNPFFGRTPSNYKGWGKGGYIEELGFHIRSTWERDYLLALKREGIEFQYEPRRFDLGDSTYLPDIYFPKTDRYVEITGWDKPIKKQKRKKFKEIYDVELLVINEKPTDASIERLKAWAEGGD